MTADHPVSGGPGTGGPRARYREQNRAEIKRIALEQLATDGPAGLSLSAIAKRMGFTGPALYRYVAGRDELLTELIVDAYRDAAARVEEAAASARRRTPARQFLALADAFRSWALAEPHRYLLVAGTPVPGYQAPERTRTEARRVLGPFLTVLGRVQDQRPEDGAGRARYASTDRQFAAWISADDPAAGDWVAQRLPDGAGGSASEAARRATALRATVTAWARMHGLVSLEIQGSFEGMGFAPGALYTAEMEALIEQV